MFKQFLLKNTDVFAWSPTDMPGIDPEVICHKLSIKADTKPVKQNPERMTKNGVAPSAMKSIAYSSLASFEKRSAPTGSLIPSS